MEHQANSRSRAHIPKLIELLKGKIEMCILEPSSAPYSNRWFTVLKKNGTLRFIQDLQPVNQVTIRNAGVGLSVDEFAEAFAGRSIYSIGDLYSGYDQFQLAMESRDITTMRTPFGLVRMCTLPQGGTTSVPDSHQEGGRSIKRTSCLLEDRKYVHCTRYMSHSEMVTCS